jgi:hypothetical protein
MSNLQRHHKSQHSTLDDPMLAALQSSAKSAKFSNSSTLQLDAGSVRESVMLFFLRIPGLPWGPALREVPMISPTFDT